MSSLFITFLEFLYYLSGISLLPFWNFFITFREFLYYLSGISLLPFFLLFRINALFSINRNQGSNQVSNQVYNQAFNQGEHSSKAAVERKKERTRAQCPAAGAKVILCQAYYYLSGISLLPFLLFFRINALFSINRNQGSNQESNQVYNQAFNQGEHSSKAAVERKKERTRAQCPAAKVKVILCQAYYYLFGRSCSPFRKIVFTFQCTFSRKYALFGIP